MYIVLPLLDTPTSTHTSTHTYLDMHGRHDVCDSGVFVHMCVYVCVIDPTDTDLIVLMN